MFKKMRNQVFSSIVVLAMVFSLVPALQIETKADDKIAVQFSFDEKNPTLSWSTYDGADYYKIYKAENKSANYNALLAVDGTQNSISDPRFRSGYFKVCAIKNSEEYAMSDALSYEKARFGDNTYVFDEGYSASEIQKVIDDTYKYSEAGQFGANRQAFLFKPRSDGKEYDVTTKVGFYTQVAGLGLKPTDVGLKQIECKARWMIGKKYDDSPNYNALCNFWRSVENVSSSAKLTVWAVSQATSMRKVNLSNGINLHDEGGYASGGFLADSKVGTFLSSGSQQQWLSRNVNVEGNYQPAVWNNVLVGSKTSIGKSDWPRGTSTVVDKTPVIAEKPYLSFVDNDYKIVVPKTKKDVQGVSWEDYNEGTDYSLIDSGDYYVAKPSDSAATINAKLVGKKGLVFQPGIYNLSEPIVINDDNFVVLGLGYATLKPTSGNECMRVCDVKGVRLAGLLFDAGGTKSADLLKVGETKNNTSNADNPTVISDCFFRVGGADNANCQVENCVKINSNDVICDNFWVWRADHGSGVGWNKNTADNGVTFNGDNITAYGLMVEHFQKYQTIWNGNGGRTYMYQSELPYDAPSQSAWNAPGTYGYTDYYVAPSVTSHEGYGMGIYSCYQKAQCFLKSAVECPKKPGVKFTNVLTYSLVGRGGIDFVINDAGYGVYAASEMAKILTYENGVAKADREGDAAKKNIMTCSYDPEIPNKVYTGKAIEPIKSMVYQGITLRKGVDYTLTYKNNVKIGKATIVIKGIGNFRETDTLKFKIVPGKVKITKAKGTKKKIKLKYKKVKGAGGYEIQWAKKKSFKGKKVKKTKKLKYTIKRKDKKRKKYYVRVRAYKKVKGKYYYGKFSKKKKVK
ncbi:MAG: sialidase [Eubacterium sp.]|nr:sialidase [Eubacterium sp.]